MTTSELFNIVSGITQENVEAVNKAVKKLSDNQLNWVPNPGVWSIRQVLAHLNEYGNYYHPVISKRIELTRFTSTKEAFISSPLGRSAWKSMKLGKAKNVKRKFKAPKDYNPILNKSIVTGSEIESFMKHQNDLLSIIDKSRNVNIRRVKIPISISKIVRLRLGDALLFVVYHNQRHVQQILNLRNSVNFPKQ